MLGMQHKSGSRDRSEIKGLSTQKKMHHPQMLYCACSAASMHSSIVRAKAAAVQHFSKAQKQRACNA